MFLHRQYSGDRSLLDHKEDYPALVKIFAEGNKMPRTWTEWLKMAEKWSGGLKAYGHVVMRVLIDPNISGLVRRHGTSPNGEGRKRLVAAAVNERCGDQNCLKPVHCSWPVCADPA